MASNRNEDRYYIKHAGEVVGMSSLGDGLISAKRRNGEMDLLLSESRLLLNLTDSLLVPERRGRLYRGR